MKKLRKKIIIGVVMLSMITMYGAYPAIPYAKAVASITSASDTITDSDPLAVATHTFDFTIAQPLIATDVLVINLDQGSNFSGIIAGNVTCPATTTVAVLASKITCTATGAVTSGTLQVIVTGVTNPVAGNYRMDVYTAIAGEGTIYERAEPMVAIVDNVLMTARVTSTLNFTIAGTATTTVVNGVSCDLDTSASSTLLDFGTLNLGASTTICQELTVATNASQGYSVVVYQDDELRNSQGDSINSFKDSADGTGSTTPQIWTTPLGTIDQFDTYGHMGLTSDDLSLTGPADPFGATGNSSLYVGFNGYTSANAVEVMYHGTASDGTTIDVGRTYVAYTVEISGLQEAGDYETILTYVATPTY